MRTPSNPVRAISRSIKKTPAAVEEAEGGRGVMTRSEYLATEPHTINKPLETTKAMQIHFASSRLTCRQD